MIKVTNRGSFKNFEGFAARMRQRAYLTSLEKYGPVGVQALAAATPTESGETARSWYYFTINRPGYFSIQWANSHMESGISIAAILQYGHGTKQGVYVEGVEYINPAMRPIFDQIAQDMWKEVTR
jgi:hypothetical protein